MNGRPVSVPGCVVVGLGRVVAARVYKKEVMRWMQ